MRCVDKESFITLAREAHGDRYDYSRVVYGGYNVPVEIGCSEHGWFRQTPFTHRQRKGCPTCGRERHRKALAKGTERFIEQAREVHGDLYGYDRVEFVNTRTHVEIQCPSCGPFRQEPERHLGGRGCPKCRHSRTQKTKRGLASASFEEKAREVHGDRYDYSSVDYQTARLKVAIGCRLHGPWMQTPNNHLTGHGCPRCAVGCVSEAETAWLDALRVEVRQHPIPQTPWVVDGFDPLTNTVYEFLGDYWHGNPQTHQPDEVNEVVGLTFGELYEKTMDRLDQIGRLGYTLVVRWESDAS